MWDLGFLRFSVSDEVTIAYREQVFVVLCIVLVCLKMKQKRETEFQSSDQHRDYLRVQGHLQL